MIEMANRWLLSQFADPNHMCFAISQTADPLGATTCTRSTSAVSPTTSRSVCGRTATMSRANESSYTAYAFDRAKMLAGDPTANFVKFTGRDQLPAAGRCRRVHAPDAGAAGCSTRSRTTRSTAASTASSCSSSTPNFATPAEQHVHARSTSLPIAPFTYTVCGFFNFNCIRQQGTAQRVDAVSEWPMHRFAYRKLRQPPELWSETSPSAAAPARRARLSAGSSCATSGSGWTLFQEGTHDPGDGHDRFMGSIAMDEDGNIALGYSVSSSTLFPSDPLCHAHARRSAGHAGAGEGPDQRAAARRPARIAGATTARCRSTPSTTASSGTRTSTIR